VIAPGRDARHVAARLCLVDFPGPEPTARLERLVADGHVGGVVLFRKNVVSAAQVAALTAALRRVARDGGAPLPWVAIDHEGGAVDRFAPSGDPTDAAGSPDPAGAVLRPTRLPAAMALGAAGDPGLARDAGRVAGRELRALGIHLNFAPVMDVNSNPANPIIGTRAFGGSPALVEAMGVAYLGGLQAEGVGAAAKHFPGHGDVIVDSHLALPVVEHARDRLEAVELPPFRAAARAGAAAVMTAHVVFPALDPARVPATMSAPALAGLLREQWGYDGLICSDSLSMRAIADHFGAGDAAVAAVRAGCDLVLALGADAMQDEVADALARGVESGALPSGRIAAALARLDRSAARWVTGGPPPAGSDELASVVGIDAHRQVAQRIAEAAVTLVRDAAGLLPFGAVPVEVVTVDAGAPAAALCAALRRHGADARETAAAEAAGTGAVVAVTRTRGIPSPATAAAVRDLQARTRDHLVVVSAGDPYDLAACPDLPAYLAVYGVDPASVDAVARVLLGRLRPSGRLPVRLSGAAPSEAGRA
jgi:beta-N-acetylhexosaminidase